MDADLEIRVTRSGRRARQLVIIPDADISEAEAESEDDVDDPDYGTTVPTVSQDDESDLSTDDDDIPSANLFQTTSSKSRNKNGHNFRWRSMNQPLSTQPGKMCFLIVQMKLALQSAILDNSSLQIWDNSSLQI
ncbi:hypothetical protein Bpfe_025779 [Biomphalaria pfeifferi]|uniref:PiggyBac transposable element-derived protein domain-containing protein n=1 Tax=Biomphalaria pfeifferi TaxID=112525 RepID=A0AAD8AYP7_BIOPF|nr:hypothetical protein Bpfe_025779 [Biomphalaria pfeifferi]